MEGRLLSADPITRTTTIWHEQAGDEVVVESVQDVEPLLIVNRERYNSYRHRDRWTSEHGNHVASIDMVTFFDLIRKGIINPKDGSGYKKDFDRWLNDRDNQKYRVRPGRV